MFTVRGSGTVVTGTLEAGTVASATRCCSATATVVVRSIQSLGRDRAQVSGGARVALNLRGVSPRTVARGDVLLGPGDGTAPGCSTCGCGPWTTPSGYRPAWSLHVGTHAAPCTCARWARHRRLTLPRDLPLLAGDRAVLRDPGRHAVVAGVEVLDADPPQLRRRGAARDRGQALADGRPDAYHEIARRGAVPREHLTCPRHRDPERPDLHEHAGWIVTDGRVARLAAAASDAVVQWAASTRWTRPCRAPR